MQQLSTLHFRKEPLFAWKRIHYSSLLEMNEISADCISDQFGSCFETEVPHNSDAVRNSFCSDQFTGAAGADSAEAAFTRGRAAATFVRAAYFMENWGGAL